MTTPAGSTFFRILMPNELHTRLKVLAAERQTTMNALILEVMAKYVIDAVRKAKLA
jgi:predicted HicB family RNase H-like nuclease